MRNARRLLGGLVALLLVTSAQEVSAAGKGWLERLSGPGPFEGFELSTLPIWCFTPKDDAVKDGVSPAGASLSGFLCSGYQTAPDRSVFVTFTFSDLESQRNNLEYDPAETRDTTVGLQSYVFSLEVKLHPGLPSVHARLAGAAQGRLPAGRPALSPEGVLGEGQQGEALPPGPDPGQVQGRALPKRV
jgi:hypothetical protein